MFKFLFLFILNKYQNKTNKSHDIKYWEILTEENFNKPNRYLIKT